MNETFIASFGSSPNNKNAVTLTSLNLERETRFESFDARLRPRGVALLVTITHYTCYFKFGAGNEIRTRDPNLGKVVLYH